MDHLSRLFRTVLLMAVAAACLLAASDCCDAATGDVNGDGEVDSDDAVYLLYHVFFPGAYPVEGQTDMDGDGVSDSDDAVYLLYHVFFPEEFPLYVPHSVSYELYGGVAEADMPTEYGEGRFLEVPTPEKEGYAFLGWYLDSLFIIPFDGSTDWLEDDITLHALWEESKAGTAYVYYVTGEWAGSEPYNVSGSCTRAYLCFDPDEGRYLVRTSWDLDYLSVVDGSVVRTDSIESVGYDELDRDAADGAEVLETMNGWKECLTYQVSDGEKRYDRRWAGEDDGILYMQELRTRDSNGTMSMMLSLSETQEYSEGMHHVVVYAERGLEAAGTGEYYEGQHVRLSCMSDGFGGWYDSSWRLISADRECVVPAGGSDMFVFAACKDPETLVLEDDFYVDAPEEALKTIWTLYNIDTMKIVGRATSDYANMRGQGGMNVLMMDYIAADGEVRSEFVRAQVMDSATRTFVWKDFDGKEYALSVTIDYEDVLKANGIYGPDERKGYSQRIKDRSYVEFTLADPDIGDAVYQIADYIQEKTKRWNDARRINLVLSFVQSLTYEQDRDYNGIEEYYKFPIETLFEMRGDCEDTTFLFDAICERLGYRTALIIFDTHMAAGVDCSSLDGYTFSDDEGNDYVYCETTRYGYKAGNMPKSLMGKTAKAWPVHR